MEIFDLVVETRKVWSDSEAAIASSSFLTMY